MIIAMLSVAMALVSIVAAGVSIYYAVQSYLAVRRMRK